MSEPEYVHLERVLALAYDDAAYGKGKDRHATNQGVELPFHEQPIVSIGELVGVGFELGQAVKKIHEASELPKDRAMVELLGAINYCAAAYLILENV